MDPLSAADAAFAMFLATIQPSDLSDWEFRLYRHFKLLAPNGARP